MAATPRRALDRLKQAANMKPICRSVTLTDGSLFEFYSTPLTFAEREKAQKTAGSEDVTQFALQLLILKATDENGQRMFAPGEIAELKRDVRDADLQACMLALLTDAEEEEIDQKKSK